ncbi:MAG: hypothetical protein E7580_08365 [Ruminococcaceae bacterium]|nr:hypothetical protein [Oscillospiraceae bacterium]
MNQEIMSAKERAILLAKDKVEEAAEAISEFLPDAAEELNWFLEEMGNQLTLLRSDRLSMMESRLYSGEAGV